MGINWIPAIGSALAAVSSAVLLSTLGVAGTLVGAALGSLVFTVGGSLYSSSLSATKERVLSTSSRARGGGDREGVPDELPPDHVLEPLAEEDETAPGIAWNQMLRDLPWKRIVAGTAALFVIAMALIVGFELVVGRPVSSYTGGSSETGSGTSIPGVGGRDGSGTDEQDPQPDEAPPEEAPQDEVPQDEAPQDPQPGDESPQNPQPGDEATPSPQPGDEATPNPQPGDEAPPEPQPQERTEE